MSADCRFFRFGGLSIDYYCVGGLLDNQYWLKLVFSTTLRHLTFFGSSVKVRDFIIL
jgi:hypothetical protein